MNWFVCFSVLGVCDLRVWLAVLFENGSLCLWLVVVLLAMGL